MLDPHRLLSDGAARERFLKALRGEAVDRPPVWLMRQAGRYLPGYREVRAAHGFWEVCQTPELATKVALEPLSLFKLDAAIVFSDILVIPEALGLGVTFGPGEGPRIANVLREEKDLERWQVDGVAGRLRYVTRAVAHLRETLAGRYGIIGFAGAPFTLLAYICEGQGSDDFGKVRALLYNQPALAERALALLADAAADLLLAEIEAGADVVQLFDTWGGLLSAENYRRFAAPAIRRIADKLHAHGHKVLLFVRGGAHLLPVLGETGADGFSLDWRVPFAEARARYPEHLLQGNIDPVLLFAAPEAVARETRAFVQGLMAQNQGRRTIVNLGHGLLPQTPVASVAALCDAVAASADAVAESSTS